MKSGTIYLRPIGRRARRRHRFRRFVLFLLGFVLILAGGSLLVAWLGAPWAVDRALARYVAAGPGRSAGVESVHFNPLTLEADLVSLRLEDGPAQSAASAESISFRLSLASLRARKLIFESIRIASPALIVRSPDQALSLGERLRTEWLSALEIRDLALSDGRLSLAGSGGNAPEIASGIDIGLSDFDGRSDPDSSAPATFRLSATIGGDVNVTADGAVDSRLGRAAGQLRLSGLRLEDLRPRLGPWDAVNLLSGRVAVNGNFTLTAPLDTPVLELVDARTEISDLSLAPAAGLTAHATAIAGTTNLEFSATAGELPVRGSIALTGAEFAISDERGRLPRGLDLRASSVLLTVDAERDDLVVEIEGDLVAAGSARMSARLPADASGEQRISFSAGNLPAAMLSRFTREALGRQLDFGRADVAVTTARSGSELKLDLNLLGRRLTFAAPEPGATVDPAGADLDIALALLTKADGSLRRTLSFAGSTSSLGDAIATALRTDISTLAANPLASIAQLIPGDVNQLRAIPFRAGDAALDERALATIRRLADVLTELPRLGLIVRGGYDAVADRDELATQQIQLHVLLATAGPAAEARPRPVDFSSPRAQDVLDEFAGERLPAARVAAIAAEFGCDEGATPCRNGYYAAIFAALVANEEITPGTLTRLGRFRAQSVVEAFSQRGIDPMRIQVVTGAQPVAGPAGIELPLELIPAG